MPEFSQIDVQAASGGILPVRQDVFMERATLDFTGKEAGCIGPNEFGDFSGQNAGEGTEYLLKLVASLEACNTALLNKLNQTERELSVLRQAPAQMLPKAKSNDDAGQSYGWERKLTRMGWRPP